MENLQSLTVKQLQAKCREIGISSSGKKAVLIERLETNNVKARNCPKPDDLAQRVLQLEELISNMRTQASTNNEAVGFVPEIASSPLNDSGPHTNSVSFNGFTTASSSTPQTNVSQMNPFHVTFASPHSVYGERYANTENVIAAPCSITTPMVTSRNVSSYVIPTTSVPVVTQANTFMPRGYAQQMPPNTFGQRTTASTYVQQPTYSSVPQPYISLQPFVSTQQVPQNMHHCGNNYANIREILNLLPDFNPTSNESLNSLQFVKRVEMLKAAYRWDDQTVIFAVQQKMSGPAKHWIDSMQEVFLSWPQFTNQFLSDFPCSENVADVHIKMSQMTRRLNESPQEYYYKMLCLGKKGGLTESAITRHIVNGISDPDLKRKISNNYVTCNQLLCDINSYCNYNEIKTPNTAYNKVKKNFNENTKTEVNISESKKSRDKIKCYNCSNYGHYSSQCPEPQKKTRCANCNKTSHKTEECRSKQKENANVNKVVGSISKPTENLIKAVRVNGVETEAFVDSGSDYSLIRKTFTNNITIITNKLKCRQNLRGFAGGECNIEEKVIVTMEIDDIKFDVELMVVSDELLSHDIYLGRNVLCQEGKRIIIEGGDCRIEDVNAIDTNETATEDVNKQLQSLLIERKACFAENVKELGKCNLQEMEIQVTTSQPICVKPYKVPFAKRAIVANIVEELLENDIIRKSNSPYASGVVLVEKKNGEHRLCVDFRQLNKITVKIPYPMPVMEEQFAKLSGNCYFTTLDLRMGYHQIEIAESSKKFTAFVTSEGHYEFNRMPFGLVNAPAVFQAIMNRVAERMNPGEVLIYLDDVIIPSRTLAEGIERLGRFLKILEESGLTLRMDKCCFLAAQITYLGHNVSANGITPGDEKITAIRNYKVPKNATEVRRFLGLTGFFRKFVENYSLIARPLTSLLRKSEENRFHWDEPQQQAFSKLIDVLTKQPVLVTYDMSADHEVHTDASSLGLAGVLLQRNSDDRWQPVMYFSRHCSDTEAKYHSYELEVLAVVETLERFRIYLLGKPFRVVTDCAAITRAKTSKELLPKIARWLMKLLEFDCEFVHREGSRMAHVDALSRSPDLPANEPEPAGFVMNINAESEDWIYSMQIRDEKLNNIIKILRGDIRSDQGRQLKTDFILQNQRLYRKTASGLRLVIPKAVRWRIAKHCHDDVGHFGLEKTMERVQRSFWFPRMRKYLKEYIAACTECCYNKAKGGKREGELHYGSIETLPFRLIHIDHLGPFVKSKSGHTHVLAISDAFTKFAVVKAVRNTKIAPVITALNELSSYFGLPKRIVTDRGTAFTSKMFEEYCDVNNIQHIKTAVRTPRANGQVERLNQIILNYLRTSTEETKDWDKTLYILQWSINSQKNSTTGFCPNELIFNYNPIDVTQNRLLAAIQDDVMLDDAVTIDEKCALAAKNIQQERERWKKRFDDKHTRPTTYSDGDLVLLENEPQSSGDSRKLEPKYRGPYTVTKVLGNDRYLIEDIPGLQITNRKFCSVYISDKMKRWCSGEPELDIDDNEVEDDLDPGLAELSA